MLVLFDSKNEINAIYPTSPKELGLSIGSKNVGDRIINGTTLDIYEIVVVAFLVTDKANQIKFFADIFLMANVNSKIVFKILFLNLSGVDIDFLA